MGSHPLNLALRFLLELVALGAMGYWGWTQHEGTARWLWAIGLPLVAAVLWGTFAVPTTPVVQARHRFPRRDLSAFAGTRDFHCRDYRSCRQSARFCWMGVSGNHFISLRHFL